MNTYYAGEPEHTQLNWGQYIQTVKIYSPDHNLVCEVDIDFKDTILNHLNRNTDKEPQ